MIVNDSQEYRSFAVVMLCLFPLPHRNSDYPKRKKNGHRLARVDGIWACEGTWSSGG